MTRLQVILAIVALVVLLLAVGALVTTGGSSLSTEATTSPGLYLRGER
jgi:flagellar basal body-associated protein FliL